MECYAVIQWKTKEERVIALAPTKRDALRIRDMMEPITNGELAISPWTIHDQKAFQFEDED